MFIKKINLFQNGQFLDIIQFTDLMRNKTLKARNSTHTHEFLTIKPSLLRIKYEQKVIQKKSLEIIFSLKLI